MSRIEELPDDYDTSIPLPQHLPSSHDTASYSSTVKNGDSEIGAQGDSPAKHGLSAKNTPVAGPAPPATQSVDEVVADLQKSPFFMTSLPQKGVSQNNGGEPEENLELAAMQALQYEGTRAEIAGNFRETGNDMAKEKKWSDAREFYNKALAALKVERSEDEMTELKEKGISEVQEEKKERELEIACLGNRALCQLELSMPSLIHVLSPVA